MDSRVEFIVTAIGRALAILPYIAIGWFLANIGVGVFRAGSADFVNHLVLFAGGGVVSIGAVLVINHSGRKSGSAVRFFEIISALIILAFLFYCLYLYGLGWQHFNDDRVMTASFWAAWISVGWLLSKRFPTMRAR